MNDIGTIVRRELEQARGYDSDTLSAIRAEALKLYQGIMAAAPEGRSQIVSLDVADALHATLAQISPVIRTSQVEFEATSQDDETQAETESDFTRVSIERAGGYDVIDDATHDALLIGNGWLHVYVDDSKQAIERRYPPGLSDAEHAAIQQAIPPEVEYTVQEGKTETIYKLTVPQRKLKIESPAPEDMMFSDESGDSKINDLRFVARRRLYSVAQLRDRGVPLAKIEALPDATGEEYDGNRAREGQLADDGNTESVQDANRLKVIYCCYIRLEKSKGRTELRHVWIGETGSEVLIDEPADAIPFIVGSAITMPHRITGTGFGQVLRSIQYGKTHVLRAYMDNLTALNSSRIGAVEGQVNMSDLTNGRINGVVRMRSPDAIVPLPSADIGPQAVAALGYLDSVRTQRVGASLDFNEVQAQLMGTSATAAAGQLSKVEQMGGWFAGNIVKTMLLPLFMEVHRVLRTDLAGPSMARIAGKWQQTDTSQWQTRMVTDIQMGLTTVEKAERMMALSQTIQQLQAMIQSGGNGVITDLPRLHAAMSDWIRTANLGAPSQYLIDPKSPEAQQAQQSQQQQAEKQKSDMVQIQMSLQTLQNNFELEKQKRDLQFKQWDAELNAEIEEAKLTSSGIIEVKKMNIKGSSNGQAGSKEDD